MDKIHQRRFRKLGDFLRALSVKKFNYTTWVEKVEQKRGHACGTVCCAAGWLPAVDRRNWAWESFEDTDDNGIEITRATPMLRRNSEFSVDDDLSVYFGNENFEFIQAIFHEAAWYYDISKDVDGDSGQLDDLAAKITPKHVARLIHYVLKHDRLPAANSLRFKAAR